MVIVHDPDCIQYAAPGHVERPFRALGVAQRLRERHPQWPFVLPTPASDADLLRAHTAEHLARVRAPGADFDADTAALPGIEAHARRAAGAAIDAAKLALKGDRAFSLMRPPGHHAMADRAMGFCYFNSIAIAALAIGENGAKRIAVWDFDAHHGNGTEAILKGRDGVFFASVHQFPAYPGTGASSFDNVRNDPVAPYAAPERHMATLRASWQAVCDFQPELILVSAGFDAYAGDPITQMTLREEDFAEMGRWVRRARFATAAVMEGGYSEDLPGLVDAFLTAWENG